MIIFVWGTSTEPGSWRDAFNELFLSFVYINRRHDDSPVSVRKPREGR